MYNLKSSTVSHAISLEYIHLFIESMYKSFVWWCDVFSYLITNLLDVLQNKQNYFKHEVMYLCCVVDVK